MFKYCMAVNHGVCWVDVEISLIMPRVQLHKCQPTIKAEIGVLLLLTPLPPLAESRQEASNILDMTIMSFVDMEMSGRLSDIGYNMNVVTSPAT